MLHELKLVVTLQPGQVLLLPSACITHENTPLGVGDERYSMTLFAAAGLFRWVNYGGQSFKEAQKTMTQAERRDALQGGLKRWRKAWARAIKTK